MKRDKLCTAQMNANAHAAMLQTSLQCTSYSIVLMWIPYDLTDIWLTTCGCPILIFRVFWPFVRTPMNPAGKQHSIMVCDRGLKLWIRLALYPQPNPISRTSQSLCSRGSNRIGWPNVCNCPKRLHTELRNMCDLQFFCAFLHIWLLPFHHNLPAQSPKAPKFGRTQKCWLAKRTPNQKQISACWPSASSNCSLPSRSREKNSPSAQSWNSFFDLQGCSERIQFSSSTVFFRSLLVLFSCLYFATAWPVYYPCLSVNQIPISPRAYAHLPNVYSSNSTDTFGAWIAYVYSICWI